MQRLIPIYQARSETRPSKKTSVPILAQSPSPAAGHRKWPAEGCDESMKVMEEEAHVSGQSAAFSSHDWSQSIYVNASKRQVEMVMRITEGLREDMAEVFESHLYSFTYAIAVQE